MNPEGWYVDPFGVHGARWISDGIPTGLVRDGGVEAEDAPPDRPFDGPLEPIADAEAEDGADLLRADESAPAGDPGDGPFQAFTESGGGFV